MNLYDIHTHRIPTDKSDSCDDVVSILNVYPSDFDAENKIIDNRKVYYSCGMHPWYLQDVEQQYNLLSEIVKDKRVVAIGEAGLDKAQGADLETQEKAFSLQIELAQEVQKPLIIHCVKAWDELIALYKRYKPTNSWIIHGFRGNRKQAEQLSRIGLKFSIGSRFNEEALQSIPLDSLFVETDMAETSIYTNYQQISLGKGVLLEELARMVEKNVLNAFFL